MPSNYTRAYEVEEFIIEKLNAYAKVEYPDVGTYNRVLRANQISLLPILADVIPYATVAILSSHINDYESSNMTRQKVASSNPSFDWDIKRTWYPKVYMILSVSSFCSDNPNISINIAEKKAINFSNMLKAWFEYAGQFDWQKEGLRISDVTNTVQADTILTANYERRYTFDVRVYYGEEISVILPTIETVNIVRQT